MLINPFTPSEIAARPDQFFGRHDELKAIEASLPLGSVLIQGPIGIGKSSLLGRALDIVAGQDCETCVVVADRELDTTEAAAQLVLDALVHLNEKNGRFRLKFGLKFLGAVEPTVEVESKDAVRDLRDGRYLAALKRILEADYRRRKANKRRYLVLGIDEADKAPGVLARLVRSVWTHCQQVGVGDVRFAIAGVSPLHQEMVAEDRGIERAFNRVLTLSPMTSDETGALLWSKFTDVLKDAEAKGVALNVDPEVIDRIAAVSGGHPHIVQLLGSHIIQHENDQPDGLLSVNDLLGVLQRICYEDRKATYAATLHLVQNAGKLDALSTLLKLVEEGFPTRIFRQEATSVVAAGDIQWLVEHDILVMLSADEYGLVDEFLRIRLALDAEKPELRADVERELVAQGHLVAWDDIENYYADDDPGDEDPVD